MKGKSMLISAGITVSLAVLATGAAISAQDKYTVKVPNGLAFSEFRGYEAWQTISVSHNGPHPTCSPSSRYRLLAVKVEDSSANDSPKDWLSSRGGRLQLVLRHTVRTVSRLHFQIGSNRLHFRRS